MAKSKILYAAYGSNMNLGQMKERCPAARISGIGVIKGYELEFRGYSSWGGGVATIAPKKGPEVPVLIWELTEACEKSLDIYEGYPSFYEKKHVRVKLLSDGYKSGDYGSANCMVYIMTDGHEISPPSKLYLTGIAEGYKSAGIPLNPLYEALDKTLEQSRLRSR